MFYVLLINYVLWSIYKILQGSGTASGTVVQKRSSRICRLNSRLIYHIRKGVPASPFLRHPPVDPGCSPLFKIFVSPVLFSAPLPFKVFLTVFHSLTQTPPALMRPNNPSWIKQISKGRFCQFSRYFLSKSSFNLLDPFTNRLS